MARAWIRARGWERSHLRQKELTPRSGTGVNPLCGLQEVNVSKPAQVRGRAQARAAVPYLRAPVTRSMRQKRCRDRNSAITGSTDSSVPVITSEYSEASAAPCRSRL